eukprot:789501-Rhodomonas_salina.1
MVWELELMLSRFSKNWNDHAALGITEQQLKNYQSQWLVQIIRLINSQGLNTLVEMFIVKGDNSSLQDVFRGILTTKHMQEVALGQHFNAEWAEKLERNPFIQALVSIKLYFESLTEVSNVNLATELAAVLVLPSKTSLHELIQHLDAVIDPIAKTFTSLDDFLNYLKSSIQYEKAYDQLRDAINKGWRLSLQNVETAVELAESHLRNMGNDEDDKAANAVTEDTAVAAKGTPKKKSAGAKHS